MNNQQVIGSVIRFRFVAPVAVGFKSHATNAPRAFVPFKQLWALYRLNLEASIAAAASIEFSHTYKRYQRLKTGSMALNSVAILAALLAPLVTAQQINERALLLPLVSRESGSKVEPFRLFVGGTSGQPADSCYRWTSKDPEAVEVTLDKEAVPGCPPNTAGAALVSALALDDI